MEKTLIRRFTLDKIASAYEEISDRTISGMRRNRLNNLDFAIISNNCWGGHVYRWFGLPYNSPTVGVYFYADEYIRFLRDLNTNLHSNIKIIDAFDSRYYEIMHAKGQDAVPVGVLNNKIEVVFLHYHTKEEAYEKWNRRVERLNINNLIVKFSEMNQCTLEHLIEFESFKFNKKVLFLARNWEGLNSGVVVKRYTHNNEISDDTTYFNRYIDLVKLINS